MANIPRRHDTAFKAKIALEAALGERNIAQIASEFAIHPNAIYPKPRISQTDQHHKANPYLLKGVTGDHPEKKFIFLIIWQCRRPKMDLGIIFIFKNIERPHASLDGRTPCEVCYGIPTSLNTDFWKRV